MVPRHDNKKSSIQKLSKGVQVNRDVELSSSLAPGLCNPLDLLDGPPLASAPLSASQYPRVCVAIDVLTNVLLRLQDQDFVEQS